MQSSTRSSNDGTSFACRARSSLPRSFAAITRSGFSRCGALLRKLGGLDHFIGEIPSGATVDQLTPSPEAVELPKNVSTQLRCRAVRLHARGGLGEIFVAWDEELRREVALKLIQHPHDRDPERRERFVREAEITGRLGHPGIVPVFGIGETDDGRPCYAMRFIEGETLQAAIARFHAAETKAGDGREHDLALRGLLSRLIAVCQAVAFAHSRGVIHRDLKPSNVMLGPFQETLVVDWGLAKRTNDHEGPAPDRVDLALEQGSRLDVDLTRTGSTFGTPAYMSPEQAEGRWDSVGPTSDVYSLGATLYFLLVGQPPFQNHDRRALLQQVIAGDIPPPRRVKPSVPAALEAICQKAMATLPRDRYSGAQELATDLERWLADVPVSAWREPKLVRLSRWFRRHKVLVAASIALATTALIALSVSTLLLGREQRLTAAALLEARANFRQARQAVDDYCTNVSKELINEPGVSELRKKLFASARDFYEEFVRRHGDEPALRAELGMATRRLADIIASTETGAAAVPVYERSIRLLAAAAADDNANPATLHDLGTTWNLLGTTFHEAEEYDRVEAPTMLRSRSWTAACKRHPAT